MAIGVTPQGPAAASEGSAGVAAGSSQAQVDLWLAFSFSLAFQIARQAMVAADPVNAYAAANVRQQGAVGGNEYGLSVALLPNNSDFQALISSQQSLLLEMQNLVTLLGGFPVTVSPAFANASPIQ